MDYKINFSERHKYDSRLEGITVPAVLKTGREEIELLAKLDTGSAYCLFERGCGEALGLPIEDGVHETIRTVNSRFDAYGHVISIQVLGIETESTVYFFADASIKRNVLGRRGWLDKVRLCLVDYEQLVYVADYNSR